MESQNYKRVKDIASKEFVTIDANETLERAGKLMLEKRVGLLVVIENGNTIGVLTAGEWFKSFYLHVANALPEMRFQEGKTAQPELQLARNENAKKRAVEFKQMKVKSIMNQHLKTINENASLTEAVREMKATDLRRLLIVDENKQVKAVLGRTRTLVTLLDELS